MLVASSVCSVIPANTSLRFKDAINISKIEKI